MQLKKENDIDLGKSAESESKGKLYEIMLEVFAWFGCVDRDLDLELRPI